jgi:ABC-type branched-subunit amino acid transport system substrate-binding protein
MSLAACTEQGGMPRAINSPKKLETLTQRQIEAPPEPPRPREEEIVNQLFDFSAQQQPLPLTREDTDYEEYREAVREAERPVVQIEDALHDPQPSVRDDGMLRIAVLLPLSGASEAVATDLKNAATLAMFNMKSDRLILQFYDSKGTYNGALAAARNAVEDNAGIIVGPLFADETKGAKSAAEGVPIISFTTDRSALAPGTMSIGFLLEQQVQRIAEYAISRGIGSFAIITPAGETGDFIRGNFKKYAEAGGAEVTRDEVYRKDTIMSVARRVSDFDRRNQEYKEYYESVKGRLAYLKSLAETPEEYAAAFDGEQYRSTDAEIAALEKLSEELAKKTTVSAPDFGGVFIYGDDINDVIMIGSSLLYYDVHPDRVKFIGTSQLENPKAYGERAFRGAWYPSVSTRYSGQFDAAYKRYFGRAPNKIASLAYDAVALAASIGEGSRIPLSDILNPNGWTGINGIFRFKRDGSSERNMDIKEITGGATVKSKIISPAAASFVR